MKIHRRREISRLAGQPAVSEEGLYCMELDSQTYAVVVAASRYTRYTRKYGIVERR
jgi:hypothetical protein